MKIWCQSCGAFGKDKIWNDYEEALKNRAKKVARPDTVVELQGVEASIPGVDRYHASQSICRMQSVRNAIRAEREGYDAFVMISTIDVGFYEIKEVVDIPVVFMLENCIHFAMMFAPRFAFFTHNEALLSQLAELTKQYGIAEHMVPGGYLDLTYSDWPNLFGKPEQYVGTITQKAKEIITRGAGILIPSALPLSVWLIEQGLIEINGARILDGFGCALKMAELMVDLRKIGIMRTQYGPPSKELLASIRKLYAV
jgi:allantoin racemase